MTHSNSQSKMVLQPYIDKKGSLDSAGAREKWKTLENAIHHIFEQNASSLSFQHLYTSGYHIILHRHGDMLYSGVEETIRGHIEEERTRVLQTADGSFLDGLLSHWVKHRTAINMIRDILMYMDKNYVPNAGKLPIYDLGVKIFGEQMLKHPKISNKIRMLTLEIIRAERSGETAPQRMLLSNLTKMMTEVSKREVYEPIMEEPFLEDSTEFYKVEAANYFSTSTVPEYIRKVIKRLDEEKDRVERCLDEATKEKIEDRVKQEMIREYKNNLIEKENSGCLSMLQDWRVDDLKLLYECLKLINEVDPMVTVIRRHLEGWGIKFVTDSDNVKDPILIIDGILEKQEQYKQLERDSFSCLKDNNKVVADPIFEKAILKAFEEIVNKNQRLPEFLSLYVDSKLRKGKTQLRDEEFDSCFEKVLVVFRYLKEKDVFEKYYKNHAAKRLLGAKSCSEEAERLFIQKLKTEYGYNFTSKLEGMFQDMKVSADTMEGYKTWLAYNTGSFKKPQCDITVHVLTTTYWPGTKSPDAVSLPEDVQYVADLFKKYYLTSHSGRKLTWHYNMGTADLRLRLSTTPNRPYDITVNTQQMLVLMYFCDRDSASFGEIAAQTGITGAELKRSLLPLIHNQKLHSPLLKKPNHCQLKDFDDKTVFSFNEEFKSKCMRIKLSQVIQKENDEEAKQTRAKVDEERKWQLDAAIVRLMKARKTEEHRILVVELIKMFQGRFTPTPDDIKKRIESLIEREYLERSKDSRSRYNYLA